MCVSVCVFVCYCQGLHMSGKREVTCCLLRHLTSPPLSHTHIYNSYWHTVVFFSCPSQKIIICVETGTHTHTHTHTPSGRGCFSLASNTVCVLKLLQRDYIHNKMICSPHNCTVRLLKPPKIRHRPSALCVGECVRLGYVVTWSVVSCCKKWVIFYWTCFFVFHFLIFLIFFTV